MIKSDTGAPEADGGTGAGEFELRGQGSRSASPSQSNTTTVRWRFLESAAYNSGTSTVTRRSFHTAEGSVVRRWLVRDQRCRMLDGDVLYLTANGIRSLRSRDSSNLAVVSDVGSPVDEEIEAAIESSTAMGTLASPSCMNSLVRRGFALDQKSMSCLDTFRRRPGVECVRCPDH